MSRKITNAAPMSVGIINSRRLTMYCHILFPSLSFPSAFNLLQRIIGLELFMLLHRSKFTRKEIIKGFLVAFEL